MTRDKQREKLAKAMADAFFDVAESRGDCDGAMLAALDAIGAAGYCVVSPEATKEMLEAGDEEYLHVRKFRAQVLKGNLAEAREDMGKER